MLAGAVDAVFVFVNAGERDRVHDLSRMKLEPWPRPVAAPIPDAHGIVVTLGRECEPFPPVGKEVVEACRAVCEILNLGHRRTDANEQMPGGDISRVIFPSAKD